MGIMNRLFGGGRPGESPAAPAGAAVAEGMPVGLIQEKPVLTISDVAKDKIRAVLESQGSPARTLRISSPFAGKYTMALEPEGNPAVDDTVVEYDGFQVFVAADSLPRVEGASLHWVDTAAGGGFQFTGPTTGPKVAEKKEAPEGPEGDLWRRVQEIIDEQINPAVASHGGYIDLLDVSEGVAYVRMGGGCQGCGMANATLKQGVERLIRDMIPEIEQVLDTTDHAGGTNPYYAAR